MARIAPDEILVYEGLFQPPSATEEISVTHLIPKGTAIGMTTVLIHSDPKIFPEPHKFMPERWLTKEGKRRSDLDKYMMSFSKGTRQCLGMK
jgi:cytochrome P450